MTDWPGSYLAASLRLVPLLPRSKRPYASLDPDPGTGWQVVFCGSVLEWRAFELRHPGSNLAIRCPAVQVDVDAPDALAWAKARGLKAGGAWALRTGRGWRLFYSAPPDCPTTYTCPPEDAHARPDLLAPGRLAVVPPSIHPTGTRYCWVRGHSPADLGLAELAPLPDAILEEWRLLQGPAAAPRPLLRSAGAPGWLPLVYDALRDYLEGHGCRPRPHGAGVTARCPLHQDRNPSFSMHPERGWKCFSGCGEGRLTALARRLEIRL